MGVECEREIGVNLGLWYRYSVVVAIGLYDGKTQQRRANVIIVTLYVLGTTYIILP